MAILLLARLLLGVAYSVANPLGEAPDEADHYAYAAYISREGRLPEGPELTQSKHPPLYHLMAATVAAVLGADMDFGFLRSNPDVGLGPDALSANFFVHTSLEDWPWRGGALAMHLGRLVAVMAGVILTAAAYALGRAVWPGWRSGPLAAAAFVAFLPEALFIGGAMSNDILAAMWATIGLWLSLRSRRLPPALGAGLALGLAILTKASTAALAPVAGAAIFAVGLQQGGVPPHILARTGPQRRICAGGCLPRGERQRLCWQHSWSLRPGCGATGGYMEIRSGCRSSWRLSTAARVLSRSPTWPG